jgi:hypothetical protein
MKIEELNTKKIKNYLLEKHEKKLIEIEDEIDRIADLTDEELKQMEDSVGERLKNLKSERDKLEDKINDIYNN